MGCGVVSLKADLLTCLIKAGDAVKTLAVLSVCIAE